MANKVLIKQFRNKAKKPVAGLTPEHAIYDKNGVRLDSKLGNVNLQEFRDLQKQGTDAIKQQEAQSKQAVKDREDEILSKTDASEISSNTESLEGGNVQENLNDASKKLQKQDNKISELEVKTRAYLCYTGGTVADKVIQNVNVTNLDNCNILVVFVNKNLVDNVTFTIGNITRPLRYNGKIASASNTWDSDEAVVVKLLEAANYFDAYKIGRNSHDEDTDNKVKIVNSLSTDEQYPSAAATYKFVSGAQKETEDKINNKITPLIGTEDKEIKVSDYSPRGEFIDSSLIWTYGDGVAYASICIPIKEGSKINVKSSANRSSFATFLKDDIIEIGHKANVCNSIVNRIEMSANTEYVFDVPDDCRFLYFSYFNATVSTYPQQIIVKGVPGIFANDTPQYIKDALEQVKQHNSIPFVNIAFMTDSHGNGDLLAAGSNATKSIQALKYLDKSNKLDLLVHGGDVILTTDFTTYTKSRLLLDIQNNLKKYADIKNLVFVKGNHDAGHQNEEGTTENLDNFEYRALYQTGDAYFGTVAPVNNYFNETFYYKDVTEKKVRMIFLDSWHDYNTLDNSDKMSFGNTQEEWLCQILKSVASGWSVVIFTHYFGYNQSVIDSNPLSNNVSHIVKAFNEGGTYGTYTFNNNAKLVAVIMGHEHQDVYNNSLGFNTIRVDASFKKESDATDKDMCISIFTIDTENNVLYETRIGRGNSRSYKFGAESKQIT